MKASGDFWSPVVASENREDGSILVWREDPLGDFPRCITERFFKWVAERPDSIWMAERGPDGDWKRTTYGTAGKKIRRLASAMLSIGLNVERPLLILSGNSAAHALMALAAQHVGIPSAAIAPAYSVSSGEFSKLSSVANQITPGLIFVDSTEPYADAIARVFATDIPVIAVSGTLDDREVLSFSDITSQDASDAVEIAHSAVGPETIAKFLFTSGTTGSPKAVIQTQRMLCSNQAMIARCYPHMEELPPVVVDWAPWNHTASGNKVFNMVIHRGGTFYIDDGIPHPDHIGRTIRNLREISPTWYFNVPIGYQMLLDAMENDEILRRSFFSRLKIMMYAGAGMSQLVWDRIRSAAANAVPGGVLLATGFGSTETSPFAMMCTVQHEQAGNLGVPAPGVTLKLVPNEGKYEARIKGPSITPGYWREPELTKEAFDEEGYYCFGDAFRFADRNNPSKGFYFDGRLAENFKLASGTWVATGAVRAALLDAFEGMASDAVIVGEGQSSLSALIIPNWERLGEVAGDSRLSGEALLSIAAVQDAVRRCLDSHCIQATGSASRVTRVLLISDALSFDKGEVTDKGSVNQRAVIKNRPDLIGKLIGGDTSVIQSKLA